MGTYLSVSLVTSITVNKRHGLREDKTYTLDQITAALCEDMCLDGYTAQDTDDAFTWIIKPDRLEGNFADFLEAQFKMFESCGVDSDDKDHKERFDLLNHLRGLHLGTDVFSLLKNHDGFCLQKTEEQDSIYIPHPKYSQWKTRASVLYDGFMLFMQGKCQMESYSEILNYFTRVLALQAPTYPAAQCLKVFITG